MNGRTTLLVFRSSFIVHRSSFLPEQPQRGRWTSTGKRLMQRSLWVAADRSAEGPPARPAKRRQKARDADQPGPQPPLGADLPEANSTQDQHHVQEREENHAKLVVQAALSVPGVPGTRVGLDLRNASPFFRFPLRCRGEECPPCARGRVERIVRGTVVRCPEAADLVEITVQSPHGLRAVRRDRELSRFIMRSRPAPRQQKSHTVHERAPK